ncbi:MAG: OmpA family protein [Polyangiaceae bacterium]|nr:OmpA family protein [Polyangiaceae bacterium]
MLPIRQLVQTAICAAFVAGCGAPLSKGPSPSLRLRHIVLYQNGLGYFERTGSLTSDRLALRFREREVDDVLKSVVVVEQGLGPNDTPSTVSAMLPRSGRAEGLEEPTELELVFSPRPSRPVSIAYAVPTAAWKATYRIILPAKDQKERRALLQAWALIDNVGDEDWEDVRVTLATGAPLSYASDLRSPTMMQRPELKGIYGPQTGATGPVYAEHVAQKDTDADGILDQYDACPNEGGAANFDPRQTGCPRLVRVTESSIQIIQHVEFDKGSDVVQAASRPIVDQVAQVLLDHPEIAVLELQGHTSSDEPLAADLGMRRARAVQTLLRGRGVSSARLTVRTYGADMPIAANTTDEGRRKNRRVSFVIAERVSGKDKSRESAVVTPEGLARVPEATSTVDASSGTYRYEIANAVTLPKKSSALITLINRPMDGDDVLLFRPDPAAPQSAKHPFRAAEILNNSDIGLQPGSVSIFSGGTFVGEGVITRLLPGERSTIPYAVDTSTSVRVTGISLDEPVRIVALARGLLRVTDRSRFVTSYDITPGHNVPNTLVIRHPRRLGYEAFKLPEGTETTPEAYFIRLPVAAQKPLRIDIEEARPVERQWVLLTADGEKLSLYVRGSQLSPELQKKMDRIVALRKLLGTTEDALARIREKRSDSAERAAELRESIKTIEKTAGAATLRKLLLDRLADVTKQLDDMAVEIAKKGDEAALARAELDDAVRDLVIEEQVAPAPAASK